MTRKAFTLIELLVVIAIIAMLLAIIVPSLKAVKEYASVANCLSNQKNLALAFYMYTEENDGLMCSGYVFQDADTRDPPSWVKAPLEYNADGSHEYVGGNTSISFDARLNGIREGAIFPYLESTKMFHCPGDKRLRKGTSKYTGSQLYRYQAYRSYGMPDFYGVHHSNAEQRLSALAAPGYKMLFVEDQYDGYFNIDAWSYDPGIHELWDPLGNYHNKSCTFAFADSHAEHYKWRDPRTVTYMTDRTNSLIKRKTFITPHDVDLDWLDQHYPGKTRMR